MFQIKSKTLVDCATINLAPRLGNVVSAGHRPRLVYEKTIITSGGTINLPLKGNVNDANWHKSEGAFARQCA